MIKDVAFRCTLVALFAFDVWVAVHEPKPVVSIATTVTTGAVRCPVPYEDGCDFINTDPPIDWHSYEARSGVVAGDDLFYTHPDNVRLWTCGVPVEDLPDDFDTRPQLCPTALRSVPPAVALRAAPRTLR